MELGLDSSPWSALARCPCVVNTLSNHPACIWASWEPSIVRALNLYTCSVFGASFLLSAHRASAHAHTHRVFTTCTDSLFPHFPVSICHLHNKPPYLSSFSLSVLCKLQFPPPALSVFCSAHLVSLSLAVAEPLIYILYLCDPLWLARATSHVW